MIALHVGRENIHENVKSGHIKKEKRNILRKWIMKDCTTSQICLKSYVNTYYIVYY